MPGRKLLLIIVLLPSGGWGFYGHKEINRLAVFTLPPEMMGFYKKNIRYLSEAAVDPDRRRYAVADEAPRHFIDLDKTDPCMIEEEAAWTQATSWFPVDSLVKHGIVPWHLVRTWFQLREAFLLHDAPRILRLSADIGHYAGDANVPLHTTSNYNGQQTGQTGIHGFWESRLPELFHSDYDFFVGPAEYLKDPQHAAWRAVRDAHACVDSVLLLEAALSSSKVPRYNYESRGRQTVRVYAYAYAKQYHGMLDGMVERRFRASIKLTGDLWYTAWVDAGQPNLDSLIRFAPGPEEIKRRAAELEQWKLRNFPARDHESDP